MTCAHDLIEDLSAEWVIADKGYDSDALRRHVRAQGGKPSIPSRRNTRRRWWRREVYAIRNEVERFFNRLKHCRRIATRYDKTITSFNGFLAVATLKYAW